MSRVGCRMARRVPGSHLGLKLPQLTTVEQQATLHATHVISRSINVHVLRKAGLHAFTVQRQLGRQPRPVGPRSARSL